MYVIFEGVDTSGKSTQIELLKNSFKDAVFTKEPGGTELGGKIRQMLLHEGTQNIKTEVMLFLADRAEHFHQIVKPNLSKMVISDRGFISGIAYAYANHRDLDLDYLIDLNRFVLDGMLADHVILINTNESLIRERLNQKKHDIIEKRGIKYLLDVQDIMNEIVKRLDISHITIDASRSIENISADIATFLLSNSLNYKK